MTGMRDIHAMIPVDGASLVAKTWSAPAIDDDDPRQRIRRCMGGAAAESVVVGHLQAHGGWALDYGCIVIELARLAATEDERDAIYQALWQEMQAAFARPDVDATVDAVARALLRCGQLDDARLREIAAAAGLRTTLPLDDGERVS